MPEATNRTRSALARARCGSSHMAILLCLTGMLCIAPAVDAGPLFKWVDDKGVVHYSERLPTEATGKAAAQLNSQGAVIKRHAAALTPEQIAAREEEARLQQEADKRAREEARKNEALLKTYASEQDIDDARERALANNRDAIKNAQHNVSQAEARRKDLARQAATHKDKRLPAKLQRDIDSNEIELRDQRALLEAKQRDAAVITHRYDEDKRRYGDLTGNNRITPRLTSAEIPKN
jgi:hypothetical protein